MKTQIIKPESDRLAPDALKTAAGILNDGGIIAIPTETVYGLAIRADHNRAYQKLSELKERATEKPFTLHISNKKYIDTYIPELSLLDRQFLRKVFPGPITVIFKLTQEQMAIQKTRLPASAYERLYYNNTLGIRLPDDNICRQILDNVDGPVLATSANLKGMPPATDADEIRGNFTDKIDMIVDSGPTKFRKPSTVIMLNGQGIRYLREGVLDVESIRRMRKLVILIVCTGNTCRSPMAEGLFKSRLAKLNSCTVDQLSEKGYKIVSAGIMAMSGQPASVQAVRACKEEDIDISNHRSQLLTIEMINEADIILVMDKSHYQVIKRYANTALNRTFLLDSKDISDPIGSPLGAYRKCLKQISQAVDKVIRHRLTDWDLSSYA